MNPKTGVALSIGAIAAVIVLFATGPLAATQAQAFGGFGFHRGFGFGGVHPGLRRVPQRLRRVPQRLRLRRLRLPRMGWRLGRRLWRLWWLLLINKRAQTSKVTNTPSFFYYRVLNLVM